MIESTANQQVKKIQKLKKSSRFRKQEGFFIAEGFKMVEEALLYGEVQTIYVSVQAKDEYNDKLSHKIKEVHIEWVSCAVFGELSDTSTPQGILALVKIPEYDKNILIQSENPAFICLEDVQDPGNLGTIMRTAEGAGMTAVVLSKGCVDLFNPKVVRATMGAMFRMPFYMVEDMPAEMMNLRKEGFSVYTTQLDATQDYTQADYTAKTAVVIGNEANGVTSATSAAADKKVIIPMEGNVESLNAAVSAALLMYEIHRNRK